MDVTRKGKRRREDSLKKLPGGPPSAPPIASSSRLPDSSHPASPPKKKRKREKLSSDVPPSSSKNSLLNLFLKQDKGKHKADVISSLESQASTQVEKIVPSAETDATEEGSSGVLVVEPAPSKKHKHSALEPSDASMDILPGKLCIIPHCSFLDISHRHRRTPS